MFIQYPTNEIVAEYVWYPKDTIRWQLDMLLKDIAPYCSMEMTMSIEEVFYDTIYNMVLTSLPFPLQRFSKA